MMNWDEYFIYMLDSIKKKSKDRSTQVGAIIVGQNHNILSTGFNGFARGVAEYERDIWGKIYTRLEEIEKLKDIETRHTRPDKYLWTVHAEANAIYNAARHGVALDGSRIYIDWYPCARCAGAIIQSGIINIIIDYRNGSERETYWNERWKDDMDISKTMLKEAKIKVHKFTKE